MELLEVKTLNEKCTIVLLDTSILILAAAKPINLFSEIERLIPKLHKYVVLSSVLEELNKLASSGSNKYRLLARAALKIISTCEIVTVNSYTDADESIICFAKNNRGNVVVVTNDSDLKCKLREIGVPVIYLRDLNHLEIDGEIF